MAVEPSGPLPPLEKGTDADDPRPPVLLVRPLFTFFEQALSTRFRFLKPWEGEEASPPISREAFFAANAESCTVILCNGPTPVDAQTIACLPCLQCIVTSSAGVNHIDIEECKRRGIAVANAGIVFSEDAADYAVGLLMDVLRRISAANRYVRQGLWSSKGDYPLGTKLSGKRVGIIGLGSIGTEIAKRLHAFGCHISYHSRNVKPSYTYFSSACELAEQVDILIVSCALTAETHHIVNKDVLKALGKNGIVVNIGRGPLIDEKELVKCLVEGEVGGAGLDVFENEPYVPPELFTMDNVVLTPHTSVVTEESLSDLLKLVIANLEAFFSNKPLLTPVSL